MDRAAIERICARPGDVRELRARIVDALRSAIGADAYAFLVTDPETEVGVDPLAEVPCLPELPRLIRLKYLTTVNRWTTLGQAEGLRRATADRPEESLLWRELLRRYGIGDVASVVFRDRYGCWGFLDLWRAGPRKFEDEELALLDEIAGPVTAALRRAQARTLLRRPPETRRFGPVVLVLSEELRIESQTPETADQLRALLPPSGVPAAAYNVAAQLLAVEAGIDGHPPTARVHLADGHWLTVRAARLTPAAIAVTIETATPAERSALLARACQLTEREGELMAHVAAGCDTREIAALMFLSEYTVQDHLKSVFAKTGLRTRRSLVSLLAGA